MMRTYTENGQLFVDIHNSDVQSFKACRRRWKWGSQMCDNLTSRDFYAPFFTGSLIHHFLEQHYNSKQPWHISFSQFLKSNLAPRKPLWPEEIKPIRRELLLAKGMAQHYTRWALTDKFEHSDLNLEVLATEQKFRVPLYEFEPDYQRIRGPGFNVRFAGKWDGLARHRETGELWLLEFKTARSVQERIKLLPNDEQASSYILAAQRILGQPLAGTLYTILRKKLPESPRVLKNGFLSRAFSIETTLEHYLACIRAHHKADATERFIQYHYTDILTELDYRGNEFFTRIAVRRTQQELEQFERDLTTVVKEMINPGTALYPTGGYHCQFCRFRDPCLAKNSGQDFQAMLDVHYEQRSDEFFGSQDISEVAE